MPESTMSIVYISWKSADYIFTIMGVLFDYWLSKMHSFKCYAHYILIFLLYFKKNVQMVSWHHDSPFKSIWIHPLKTNECLFLHQSLDGQKDHAFVWMNLGQHVTDSGFQLVTISYTKRFFFVFSKEVFQENSLPLIEQKEIVLSLWRS